MSSLPKLYNAWFCPFAQRAWISLLEKGVKFEYIEQDPYNKTPEWLTINPRGLVPVIVHNGKSVCESAVCIEYVDEVWETGRRLLPKDPYQRARIRMQSDYIGKKVVPPFYNLLMKSNGERTVAKQELVAALKVLFDEKEQSSAPLFGGQALNMVDIMLVPFAYRFEVILPRYRDWSVPKAGLERYHQWYAAVCQQESVCKTMPDEEKLVESYRRYAEDTAQTLVADAVRKGTVLP